MLALKLWFYGVVEGLRLIGFGLMVALGYHRCIVYARVPRVGRHEAIASVAALNCSPHDISAMHGAITTALVDALNEHLDNCRKGGL